jgi:hypothetical protein
MSERAGAAASGPGRPRFAALLVLAVALAGCAGGCTRGSARDPACADAHRVINSSTARFTGDISKAAAATDRGDAAGLEAATDAVRQSFHDWAAALRTQAAKATDSRVRAVLDEYADAVEATIARIRTPADLDRLDSFDGTPLDAAAGRLAAVCG